LKVDRDRCFKLALRLVAFFKKTMNTSKEKNENAKAPDKERPGFGFKKNNGRRKFRKIDSVKQLLNKLQV